MTVDQDKLAHLQMIQSVIGRVASDGQNLKTLTMTAAAAIIALAQATSQATPWISPLGIALVILFWWLTSHTLYVERSYRTMYESVRLGQTPADFSMNWQAFASTVCKPIHLAISRSVLIPYATVIVLLSAVFILSIVK